MLALAEALARPVLWANRLAGWLLLLLAFVIGFDVVGRKFFDTGSALLQDLEWHLHGAAMLLAFGAAYLRDAHVRVDLIRDRLRARAKARLEVLGILLFLLPYLTVLLLFGLDYAARAFETQEGSVGGSGLPSRWIIKAFLPLGFALVLLSAVSVLLQCLLFLSGKPVRPTLLLSHDSLGPTAPPTEGTGQ